MFMFFFKLRVTLAECMENIYKNEDFGLLSFHLHAHNINYHIADRQRL